MTFALDLAKFAEKAGANADELVGGVVVRLAQAVDRRSPVGDATYWQSPPPKGYVGGRFRGNWQLGIGSLPSGTLARPDPTGSATVGRIIAAIPDDASGRVYYLANNLPYAQRIEHGWSRQAPTGVVGLTVTEFQQVVRQVAETLP